MRQGYPISPYIFVLGIEYFTRLMKKLQGNKLFKYHPKCKVLNLTHLAFAYDLMLVCKADLTSPLFLKENFNQFTAVSGLSISPQKFQVFFAARDANTKQYLLRKLGFVEGKLLVKYLGSLDLNQAFRGGLCTHLR